MGIQAFVELLLRRWWVIVTVTALAVATAGAYAWQQRHVYESTATLYVHPSPASVKTTTLIVSNELNLLSYGSLMNTFVSIAQSKSMLGQAASTLGIPPDRLKRYTAVATLRPKSFVLDVSVDGPDRKIVVPLVNSLSQSVASAMATGYPIVALSSLDAASRSTQVRPMVTRDLVYGGLAGLIVAFVLASLGVPPARHRERADGKEDSSSVGPRDPQIPAMHAQSVRADESPATPAG